MEGMAIGAWIVSIIGKRLKRCLFWHAVVELLLGISALLFHDIFVRYQEFSFTLVLPMLKEPVLIMVYRLVTGSLLILPQSVLLGATISLMSSGLLQKYNGNSGYILSMLYFGNSLGAAVGVLISEKRYPICQKTRWMEFGHLLKICLMMLEYRKKKNNGNDSKL